MPRARGANAILTGGFESVYAAAPSGGATLWKLPFVSNTLGEEAGLIPSDLLGQGREPNDPTPDVANAEGDLVVPVDARNIGVWLKLLLGAPVTSGTTSKTHLFTSGAQQLPSMHVEIGSPEVPSYDRNIGVRGNMMKISLQRSGLLNATVGLIARGTNNAATSFATGTPTELAVTRFAQATGSVKRNGVALANITQAEISLMNNLDKVESIRPDGRIEDADPGEFGFTGSITARFADLTLYDQATARTPCELTFGWEIDANTSLVFAAPRVFLPRPKRTIEGPRGIQATFQFQSAKGAGGNSLTVTLKNDVAAY